MSFKQFKRLYKRFQAPRRNLDILVVSHGGSGSTLLTSFIGRYTTINSPDSTEDGLLHCCSPDHPLVKLAAPRRIIYCYSDPRISVLSLFRRNLALGMQAKLRYFGSSLYEYRKLAACYSSTVRSLDDFILKEYDCFGINSFWRNWTTSWVGTPIMLLNYASMWDNIGEIVDFVGLDPAASSAFPKKIERNSNFEHLTASKIEALTRIYSKTICEIEQMPSLLIK